MIRLTGFFLAGGFYIVVVSLIVFALEWGDRKGGFFFGESDRLVSRLWNSAATGKILMPVVFIEIADDYSLR